MTLKELQRAFPGVTWEEAPISERSWWGKVGGRSVYAFANDDGTFSFRTTDLGRPMSLAGAADAALAHAAILIAAVEPSAGRVALDALREAA